MSLTPIKFLFGSRVGAQANGWLVKSVLDPLGWDHSATSRFAGRVALALPVFTGTGLVLSTASSSQADVLFTIAGLLVVIGAAAAVWLLTESHLHGHRVLVGLVAGVTGAGVARFIPLLGWQGDATAAGDAVAAISNVLSGVSIVAGIAYSAAPRVRPNRALLMAPFVLAAFALMAQGESGVTMSSVSARQSFTVQLAVSLSALSSLPLLITQLASAEALAQLGTSIRSQVRAASMKWIGSAAAVASVGLTTSNHFSKFGLIGSRWDFFSAAQMLATIVFLTCVLLASPRSAPRSGDSRLGLYFIAVLLVSPAILTVLMTYAEMNLFSVSFLLAGLVGYVCVFGLATDIPQISVVWRLLAVCGLVVLAASSAHGPSWVDHPGPNFAEFASTNRYWFWNHPAMTMAFAALLFVGVALATGVRMGRREAAFAGVFGMLLIVGVASVNRIPVTANFEDQQPAIEAIVPSAMTLALSVLIAWVITLARRPDALPKMLAVVLASLWLSVTNSSGVFNTSAAWVLGILLIVQVAWFSITAGKWTERNRLAHPGVVLALLSLTVPIQLVPILLWGSIPDLFHFSRGVGAMWPDSGVLLKLLPTSVVVLVLMSWAREPDPSMVHGDEEGVSAE